MSALDELDYPKVLAEALARAEAAEKLVAQWEHDIKFWGIIEIAVRNISVMDYMKHWEARAEAAEKRVIELEARLTSSADRG